MRSLNLYLFTCGASLLAIAGGERWDLDDMCRPEAISMHLIATYGEATEEQVSKAVADCLKVSEIKNEEAVLRLTPPARERRADAEAALPSDEGQAPPDEVEVQQPDQVALEDSPSIEPPAAEQELTPEEASPIEPDTSAPEQERRRVSLAEEDAERGVESLHISLPPRTMAVHSRTTDNSPDVSLVPVAPALSEDQDPPIPISTVVGTLAPEPFIPPAPAGRRTIISNVHTLEQHPADIETEEEVDHVVQDQREHQAPPIVYKHFSEISTQAGTRNNAEAREYLRLPPASATLTLSRTLPLSAMSSTPAPTDLSTSQMILSANPAHAYIGITIPGLESGKNTEVSKESRLVDKDETLPKADPVAMPDSNAVNGETPPLTGSEEATENSTLHPSPLQTVAGEPANTEGNNRARSEWDGSQPPPQQKSASSDTTNSVPTSDSVDKGPQPEPSSPQRVERHTSPVRWNQVLPSGVQRAPVGFRHWQNLATAARPTYKGGYRPWSYATMK